jgi:hypothetical protein
VPRRAALLELQAFAAAETALDSVTRAEALRHFKFEQRPDKYHRRRNSN